MTDPSVVGQTYWHTDGAGNAQAGSLVRKVRAEGILLYLHALSSSVLGITILRTMLVFYRLGNKS